VLEKCPNFCDSSLGDRWVTGRMLQQYCHECGWKGEPRIPEKLPIVVVKQLQVGQFWGFQYQVFDRYGHIMISSRYYDKKKDAKDALEKDLERGKKDMDAGPYTAVFWPARVLVEGKVFK